MSNFYPRLDTILSINQINYAFMPDPFLSKDNEVFAMEGGEGTIYQLRDSARNGLFALKVLKPSYRRANGGHIERVAATLAAHKDRPGLFLGNRLCITKAEFPRLIAEYPDLEYAVLMPWLAGKTWTGYMLNTASGRQYTAQQAYELALTTAIVLFELESRHLAHTDIAGSNIMLLEERKQVHLLDLEGLFWLREPMPARHSHGSPGYQHRKLDKRGQWRLEGDRFAGAILLTEMLTWANPHVRAVTPANAESLFQPEELQDIQSRRLQVVREALATSCPPALPLFEQAWTSDDLAQCPDFSTWYWALYQARKN